LTRYNPALGSSDGRNTIPEGPDVSILRAKPGVLVQVVSGLQKHVTVEEMKDRLVVVCTNLKPAKMREVMSYGMVRLASSFSRRSSGH
jgi:hypothetical protein